MRKQLLFIIAFAIICLLSSFIVSDMNTISSSEFTCEEDLTAAILRVKKSAAPRGDGSSWAVPYNSLQDALDSSTMISGMVENWVTNDTYYTDEGASDNDNDRNA